MIAQVCPGFDLAEQVRALYSFESSKQGTVLVVGGNVESRFKN